ncbi:MAG: hypothetical protein ACFBWO_00670 [Paracoccaceae bacterium]
MDERAETPSGGAAPWVLVFGENAVALHRADDPAESVATAALDADGLPRDVHRLRAATGAGRADPDPKAVLWLPGEQVATIHPRLPRSGSARMAARTAAAATTGLGEDELAVALGRRDGARTEVVVALAQTVREACAYARGWGFDPSVVTVPGRVAGAPDLAADLAGATAPSPPIAPPSPLRDAAPTSTDPPPPRPEPGARLRVGTGVYEAPAATKTKASDVARAQRLDLSRLGAGAEAATPPPPPTSAPAPERDGVMRRFGSAVGPGDGAGTETSAPPPSPTAAARDRRTRRDLPPFDTAPTEPATFAEPDHGWDVATSKASVRRRGAGLAGAGLAGLALLAGGAALLLDGRAPPTGGGDLVIAEGRVDPVPAEGEAGASLVTDEATIAADDGTSPAATDPTPRGRVPADTVPSEAAASFAAPVGADEASGGNAAEAPAIPAAPLAARAAVPDEATVAATTPNDPAPAGDAAEAPATPAAPIAADAAAPDEAAVAATTPNDPAPALAPLADGARLAAVSAPRFGAGVAPLRSATGGAEVAGPEISDNGIRLPPKRPPDLDTTAADRRSAVESGSAVPLARPASIAALAERPRLVGVLRLDGREQALMQFPDGRTRRFGIGDEIGGWRVDAIAASSVRLARDGRARRVTVGER